MKLLFFFAKLDVIYALNLSVESINFTSQYNGIKNIIGKSCRIAKFETLSPSIHYMYETTLPNILTTIYNAPLLILYDLKPNFGF